MSAPHKSRGEQILDALLWLIFAALSLLWCASQPRSERRATEDAGQRERSAIRAEAADCLERIDRLERRIERLEERRAR